MYLDIFENIFVFSVLAFCPRIFPAFLGTKNVGFWKRCPEWRFGKMLAHLFRVDRRKRRLSDTMMSYIIQDMSYKGCYCIYMVLVFISLHADKIKPWLTPDQGSFIVCTQASIYVWMAIAIQIPYVWMWHIGYLNQFSKHDVQIHFDKAWVSYLTVNPLVSPPLK